MTLDVTPEILLAWVLSRKYVYRHTGIGAGRTMAYMSWVRAGLFENAPGGLMITRKGLELLGRELAAG